MICPTLNCPRHANNKLIHVGRHHCPDCIGVPLNQKGSTSSSSVAIALAQWPTLADIGGTEVAGPGAVESVGNALVAHACSILLRVSVGGKNGRPVNGLAAGITSEQSIILALFCPSNESFNIAAPNSSAISVWLRTNPCQMQAVLLSRARLESD
jgi:hypothetical protein